MAMSDVHKRVEELAKAVGLSFEEFQQAVSFHAAWKPAAYDAELHARLGNSHAGRTFLVVRVALRREVILALMRLWDGEGKISLKAIGETLSDAAVLQELIEARVRRLNFVPAESDVRSELAERARLVIDLIRQFLPGGPKEASWRRLRDLRNERLAHRPLEDKAKPRAAAPPDDVEILYQDMKQIIEHLQHLVMATALRIADAEEAEGLDAKLFWESVRGEGSPGHPRFQG